MAKAKATPTEAIEPSKEELDAIFQEAMKAPIENMEKHIEVSNKEQEPKATEEPNKAISEEEKPNVDDTKAKDNKETSDLGDDQIGDNGEKIQSDGATPPTKEAEPAIADEKQEKQRKSATTYIKELKEQRNDYRVKWQAEQRRNEQLKSTLETLKAIPDEKKTGKDFAKEVLYEERIAEADAKTYDELESYLDNLSRKESRIFEVRYNEIMPELMKNDKWAVEEMSSYKEKFHIANKLFGMFNSGELPLDNFVKAPRERKIELYEYLADQYYNPDLPPPWASADAQPSQQSKVPSTKNIPDSTIVPDGYTRSNADTIKDERDAYLKAKSGVLRIP